MNEPRLSDSSDSNDILYSPDEISLLVEISRRFYVDDASKVEIANEYGLSRFKVARLLHVAKERGVVKIEITDPSNPEGELALTLASHLHLNEVILVPPDHNVVAERDALGTAAADFLTSRIQSGTRIGFSWGRTLMPIASHLGELPNAEFIQITGVVGNDPSRSPIALLSQIAEHSGGTARALISPLFCATSSAATTQRKEPSVAQILSMFDTIDIAVLSVGAWDSRVTQLEEFLSIDDAQLLDSHGAVADSNGLFFDSSGHYLDISLNERRISIGVEQLAAIECVVAVAGSLQKANAIYAMCCSGLPTCLVTTTDVARNLLTLPRILSPLYRTASGQSEAPTPTARE